MNTSPRSMNWEYRCAQLAMWVEGNGGRVPSQMSADAVERGLYSWLTANRKRLKAGTLTPAQEDLFKSLPVPERSQNTFEDRMDELETFYDVQGRLPLTTASDADEKSLARFLVGNLRSRIKKGTLADDLLARARAIPGVVEFAHNPDQDRTLQELSGYTDRHGHMPPFGKTAKGAEYRLSTWVRNNIKGNPEDKSPALKARHEAILGLMDRYPGAADAEREWKPYLREQQLRDLEAFVEGHGHLPASTRRADEMTKRTASALLAFREELEAGGLGADEELRIKVVLAYPGVRDYEWQVNFRALVRYAATHDGRLPGNWGEGKVFSWLTIQRRQYRQGQMSRERLEQLLTIDGAIPGRTTPAASVE